MAKDIAIETFLHFFSLIQLRKQLQTLKDVKNFMCFALVQFPSNIFSAISKQIFHDRFIWVIGLITLWRHYCHQHLWHSSPPISDSPLHLPSEAHVRVDDVHIAIEVSTLMSALFILEWVHQVIIRTIIIKLKLVLLLLDATDLRRSDSLWPKTFWAFSYLKA